jgi:pimeloyl-ACP methyl ester carboxylesterase
MRLFVSLFALLTACGGAALRTGKSGLLYYEIHGPASAEPPILLLHGGGSSTETVAGLVRVLSTRRQVIAYDQRGHGRSTDLPGKPFGFEDAADDAAALLESLGVTRADVFGFSNGGTIALLLAHRHPARVRKLAMVSAPIRRDGLTPGFFEGLAKGTIDDMPAELRAAYLRLAPNPDLAAFFTKSQQRMLGFADLGDGVVRGFTGPALVAVGDRDVVTAEHAVAIYRLFPKGQLAIVPGTGHEVVDHPALAAAVAAFFNAAN